MIFYKRRNIFFILLLIPKFIFSEGLEPENIVAEEKEIYRVPSPLVNGLMNFAAKLFLKKFISEVKEQNNRVKEMNYLAEKTRLAHLEDGTRSISFENFSEECDSEDLVIEKQFIEEVKMLLKEWCA